MVGSPITKVISYARVSSGIQRKSGKGIQRQLEEANAWAQQNGLTLSTDEGFRDLIDEGKSASKGVHLKAGAGMGRILQAVRDGRLGEGDVLLVEDLSRLSRLEILDGLETVLLPLIRSGLVIVTLEDGQRLEQQALNADAGALSGFVYKAQAAGHYAAKYMVETGLVAADTGVDLIGAIIRGLINEVGVSQKGPRHGNHIRITTG